MFRCIGANPIATTALANITILPILFVIPERIFIHQILSIAPALAATLPAIFVLHVATAYITEVLWVIVVNLYGFHRLLPTNKPGFTWIKSSDDVFNSGLRRFVTVLMTHHHSQ